MILITGGTGTIGKELVQILQARGVDFKVMVRQEAIRKELKAKGIASVLGDFTQPGTWPGALAGAREVFLLTQPSPDSTAMEGKFLEAVRSAGVRRVVRLSAMGANPWSSSPLARVHGQCEAQLELTGLEWTLLRPTMFMQNLAPLYGDSVARTSTLYAPAGEARIPFVDARDIAAVAALVLTHEGHHGMVYEITGAEAITYAGIADLLGAKRNRAVQYVDVPDDAAYHTMLNMGMSAWFAQSILALFHLYKANGATAVPLGTVTRITGRHPRTLNDYLQEHLQAFQPVKVETPTHSGQ